MKWQNYFPWKILQRGREYYCEGNIDDIIIDGLSLETYVFGRDVYHVHVKITEKYGGAEFVVTLPMYRLKTKYQSM